MRCGMPLRPVRAGVGPSFPGAEKPEISRTSGAGRARRTDGRGELQRREMHPVLAGAQLANATRDPDVRDRSRNRAVTAMGC
jgi:hypothetical protein